MPFEARMPDTDDRPDELPEGERPQELPDTEEELPAVEPDQGASRAAVHLPSLEERMSTTHPRRTVGAWRQSLRRPRSRRNVPVATRTRA